MPSKIKRKPSKTRALPSSLKPLDKACQTRILRALEGETLDALRARAGVDWKTLEKAARGESVSGKTRRKLEAAFPSGGGE